ncbi:hypothetical protein PROFUN_09571 [Planoprotostelium fungivorum]|uniref:Uncharacterized protein n=1 Tax=Planoprotostelium fungivorum TaxID=1890364 RepID=A0A2P6NGR4_9EUKA|nr:hypothetical protein PROFUN_09571 [Planoprotostelium fungivorum]
MCTFVDSHGVHKREEEMSLVHIILTDKKMIDPWDLSGGGISKESQYINHTQGHPLWRHRFCLLSIRRLSRLLINIYALIVATYFLVRPLHEVILPNHVVGKMICWKEFTHEHRRTMVTYVLEVVYTTVALELQFAAIPVFWLEYRPHRLNFLQYARDIVAVLYCTELPFELK